MNCKNIRICYLQTNCRKMFLNIKSMVSHSNKNSYQSKFNFLGIIMTISHRLPINKKFKNNRYNVQNERYIYIYPQ